ncbi:hypothetical protein AVEN_87297-1 [Araneus ventricosus]|uniref:Uncharacterized protein n=1 Tax=Araneus ventricosus TaxID=182803 RepID=A0A4Y2WTD7_ARAVE|nr:hypothetical protein AVEN_238050-1 [Araneus ventricosus]GBO40459.1 hypothetical protein AVEN_87297-1 [Araneus ventricosus]
MIAPRKFVHYQSLRPSPSPISSAPHAFRFQTHVLISAAFMASRPNTLMDMGTGYAGHSRRHRSRSFGAPRHQTRSSIPKSDDNWRGMVEKFGFSSGPVFHSARWAIKLKYDHGEGVARLSHKS